MCRVVGLFLRYSRRRNSRWFFTITGEYGRVELFHEVNFSTKELYENTFFVYISCFNFSFEDNVLRQAMLFYLDLVTVANIKDKSPLSPPKIGRFSQSALHHPLAAPSNSDVSLSIYPDLKRQTRILRLWMFSAVQIDSFLMTSDEIVDNLVVFS